MDPIANALRNMEGCEMVIKDLDALDIERAAYQIIKYPVIGIDEILEKKAKYLTNEDIRKLKDYRRYLEVLRRLDELENETYEESMEKHFNAQGIDDYKIAFLYPINLLTMVEDRLDEKDLQEFKILDNDIFKELCKADYYYKPKPVSLENYNFSEIGEKIVAPYIDYKFGVGSKKIDQWEIAAMKESLKPHLEANQRFRAASEISASKTFCI